MVPLQNVGRTKRSNKLARPIRELLVHGGSENSNMKKELLCRQLDEPSLYNDIEASFLMRGLILMCVRVEYTSR